MSTSKKSRGSKKDEKPKNSFKKNKKNKSTKLWQKYLKDLKSILSFNLYPDEEESLYSLRHLFEIPEQASQSTSISSQRSAMEKSYIPIINQTDKPVKITSLISTSDEEYQSDIEHLQLKDGENIIEILNKSILCSSNTQHAQDNVGNTSSNQNIKVEVCNIPKAQVATTEIKPLHKGIMVEFKIIADCDRERDVIKLDDENVKFYNKQINKCPFQAAVDNKAINNTLQSIIKTANNFQNFPSISKQLFGNINNNPEGYESTNISEDINNLSFKVELKNLPQASRPANSTYSPSENILQKIDQTKTVDPNFNFKIYKTLSTQNTDQLAAQKHNEQKNFKPNMCRCDGCGGKNYFTQNFIDIAKQVMQNIHGAIFSSFNASSVNESCESEANGKKNQDIHIKLEICADMPIFSNSSVVHKEYKYENLKLTKEETMQFCDELSQAPSEQIKIPTQFSNDPKVNKRFPQRAKINFPSLRQRQLELHQLRVQVERKRLEMLDLKIAREWEDMQRDKIIFEKYFLPKSLHIQTSDDFFEI